VISPNFRLGRPDTPNGPLFVNPCLVADGSPRPLLHHCHACGEKSSLVPGTDAPLAGSSDCGTCGARTSVHVVIDLRVWLICSLN
jgi:hypothetical protein